MKFIETVKSLFANNIDVNKVFSNVSSGIDKLGFTSQEKSEGLADFVKDTLSENTQRSKARRGIAKFLIYFYIFILLIAIGCIFFKPEFTTAIIKTIDAFGLNYAFFAVIAFYFGGYYMGKFNPKSNKKKQE